MKYRYLYAVFLWFLMVGASSGLGVQIQSGKLSVHTRGASLREVLGSITEQGGVTFKTIGRDQLPEGSVTEEFTDLSMDQGIARLLVKWNYALIKEEGTDRLKEVYIFVSGTSAGSEEKPAGAAKSGSVNPTNNEEPGKKGPADDEIRKAIEQVRKAGSPEEEAKALMNLQYFHDEQTLEEVLRPALLAVSPKVRMAALEVIVVRNVRDPGILDEILKVSVRDPDPAVREKARYISRHVVPDIFHLEDSTDFWMNP